MIAAKHISHPNTRTTEHSIEICMKYAVNERRERRKSLVNVAVACFLALSLSTVSYQYQIYCKSYEKDIKLK